MATSLYNRCLLSELQRECVDVVLVSPRNPLNVGAVARAMANFGFKLLTVVDPYEPHWREARSAVGAPDLLENARETPALADAVRDCSLVVGTGTVTHRKPEQSVVRLDELAPLVTQELDRGGRVAMVFGPEKHGLTRQDLSYCHVLVEIPTDRHQPSMNLGQAAAVCLYELSVRSGRSPEESRPFENSLDNSRERLRAVAGPAPTSNNLDLLAGLIEEVMVFAKYSPKTMQEANRHDLRLILRRLNLNAHDSRRLLGLFRRILRRLQRNSS
ncbi:RNA methyltransferase [Telmatobacter sp. DSM 110680]|uniref:RNA methyltransferase n=1 Tax=Telmatobacter sp. DSM 110680 TaxID=3036704 RepID=A0AAU7DQ69_9BACT